MTKQITSVIVPLVMLYVAPGCGTIMSGTTQNIQVRSIPERAMVTVYNARENKAIACQQTPCTISLQRGQGYFQRGEYRLVAEKDGYVCKELSVSGRPTGWYIGGNFLIGGLIGWLIVDPSTGGMWYLSPDEVEFNLAPESDSMLTQALARPSDDPTEMMPTQSSEVRDLTELEACHGEN